jgi:hypothetical protein
MMSGIAIRPVEGAADLEAFIRLPGRLATGDPAWIEPLRHERRRFLSPRHNPFFEHAEVALWLALRDGRPVGRISAQLDRLAPPDAGRRVGHFGMIDAADEGILAPLFESAEGWLRTRGAELARGPFSLSINHVTGLLVEGVEHPPFVMMDHHAPWLGPAVERRGYAPVRDLTAYHLDIAPGLPDRLRAMAARGGEGIRLRPLDPRRLEAEIAAITRLHNAAWARNWGFVPLTEAEAAAMARDLRPILIPDFVQIAEEKGELVGFILLLPNINEALAGLGGRLMPFGWARLLWRLKLRGLTSGRVPLMGVRPDIAATPRGKLLPLRMIYALEAPARARGLRHIEMSWQLEENTGPRRLIEALGSTLYKRYRVYEKAL